MMGPSGRCDGSRQKLMKLLMVVSLCVSLSFTLWFWSLRFDMSFLSWNHYRETSPTASAQHHSTQRTKKHTREKFAIMAVNGTKTLLISAFLEHRLQKKQVHVLAVALRKERFSYICRLCCGQVLHVFKGSANFYSIHYGFSYGTADIMCPLPPGCQTPTRVAVRSASNTQAGIQEAADDCGSDEVGGDFMEVKNQEEHLHSFPNNFVVCISTMYNFTNTLQEGFGCKDALVISIWKSRHYLLTLVQTLEVMKLLGVNKVVIYKSSCSPDIQRLLDYYTETGLVEVIPWTLSRFLNVSRRWLPSHGPGDIHYLGQIPALNDCMYRYMYRSKWMAMQDLDELILPQTVDSWLELLPLLEKKYGANRCYLFDNNVFPINVALPPSASRSVPLQPQWMKVSGVNILDHLYQLPEKFEKESQKFIFNPRVAISSAVHSLHQPNGLCTPTDRRIACMYHTKINKSRFQALNSKNPLIYNGRLLNYASRLIPAVDAVLKASQFIT